MMVDISDGILRSLEKPVILWLMYHKPRHGYELMVEFRRLTGRKLKPSIVYPFLHKLEREGFVSSQWLQRGKRRIKHYALTEKGEELIAKLREILAKPFREFIIDLTDKRKNS